MKENKTRLIDLDDGELTVIIEAAVERVLNKRLPTPPPVYYTFHQLCKVLNCSRVTLHNLRNAGHLEVFRPAGMKRCLVSQDQLDQFLLKNPGWAENGEVHGADNPPPVRKRRRKQRE